MVGGGSKKDERSFVISNTNVFAALDSLRKKKKSDKEKKSKSSSKAPVKEPELQVFWAPAPLNAKSWADVDDDDDDDYYATTEPPPSSWGALELQRSEEIPVAAEILTRDLLLDVFVKWSDESLPLTTQQKFVLSFDPHIVMEEAKARLSKLLLLGRAGRQWTRLS